MSDAFAHMACHALSLQGPSGLREACRMGREGQLWQMVRSRPLPKSLQAKGPEACVCELDKMEGCSMVEEASASVKFREELGMPKNLQPKPSGAFFHVGLSQWRIAGWAG